MTQSPVAMDAYDTGYSSMSNLRRYECYKIKTDRSSVAALGGDPVAEVILECALALALRKSLGMTVVVEDFKTEPKRARFISYTLSDPWFWTGLMLMLVFFVATRVVERSSKGEAILKGMDRATDRRGH